MNVNPINDRLVVERDTPEEMTANGLFIPQVTQDRGEASVRGTVRAIGPGKSVDGVRQPLELKVGDQVLIPAYPLSPVDIDGVEVVFITEDNVLGIYE